MPSFLIEDVTNNFSLEIQIKEKTGPIKY